MAVFRYHPDILARFPTIVGGVIVANGMTNGAASDALKSAYETEQQAALLRIGATLLSEVPSLSAWRRVFSGFGVDPTQYRSAAEALLRRLTKQGNIPTINTLVDAGNLVSIRYGVPVAVFDTRQNSGAITVQFAAGAERFTALGQADSEHPEPGEVIFADDSGLVCARRWCWRQSAQSAAHNGTTSAVITIEGHHATAKSDVSAALNDMLSLLRQYTGGSFEETVLDKDNPMI
jgi:DNA/RNA-binding domain of Phe-tRNA-synthetase-like protein